MKPVLVTGDAGFIGAHLVARLAGEGCEVTGTTALGIDLRDAKAVNRLFVTHRFTEVYHLAACGVRSDPAAASQAVEVNTVAAANLAQAAVGCRISRFFYMGSGFEYGAYQRPVNESTNINPINLYAASKAAASLLLQYFFHREGLPLIILRPFSVYGPGEQPPRLIPSVCSQLARDGGEPIRLTTGTQVRDYLYIDDLIDAVLAARDHAIAGAVYNLGAGCENAWPVRHVVETIARIAGRSASLCQFGAVEPARPEPEFFVADITRASRELGWSPRTSLHDGLVRTLNWCRARLHVAAL